MSNNNIQVNQGEQLSFFQLFTEKQWKIEIPIIQRDYAQGRDSAISVRNNFLDSLLDHLQTNKNIDLDFVYGSINGDSNNLFIPLDGQQRLTTLFLLHYYLAIHDGNVEHFKSFITTANKSNFTYETRTSAHEFCNALVKNSDIDLSCLIENSLSKTIKDKSWYFGSWDNDPTIKAMGNMLDAIHKKFKETSNLYAHLINTESPVITFQFLNLKKFSLTDDLYIKMNARGKQLTDFENFKAKFEQDIKRTNLTGKYKLLFGNTEKDVKAHEYFSYKIDTVWANLFWNYRNENIDDNYFDDEIMNFIRLIITNHYATVGKGDNKIANIQMLIGRESGDDNLTYLQYRELNCLDEKFISDLISIFDLLSNGDKTIKNYLEESINYDENEVFKLALANKTGYRDKLRFYGFYQYLILFKTTEGLSQWMRVVYNLTENFIYNRPEEYIRSLQAINTILPESNNILAYLINTKNKISGFPDAQIYEERLKATLIIKGDEWWSAIRNIEKHGYFTGQIGFCLNFANIEKYFDENGDCSWDEDVNKEKLNQFKIYSEKAKAVFNDDGLKKFPSHLWYRALFSKGDYLLYKGSNWSFLINDERDISWKRLLRDDNDGKRDFVRQLFDDSNFLIDNIEKSLEKIIENNTITDWRKHFINTPEILEFLGYNKCIRWISEDEIYLLRKMRLSGEHAEYFSYALFIKYLEGRPPLPFINTNYYSTSGNEEIPCAFIDEWMLDADCYAIDVRYLYEIAQFEIRFFNRDGEIKKSLIPILHKHDMSTSGKYDDDSYIINIQKEGDVIVFIQNISKELNNIK